ncbi:MAG TPA: thioredoxin domain-containing protein [Fimbriimonadaceae bacterium]|nr:thioredoxin domain-containing protein [Fimbriimonadaceae bacterium]
MPNQLVHSKSAYLRQHAENPIDWIEFEDNPGDRPLFISVGYSSCHWCHVMAHESFENDEVALVLNKHFCSIKIDREERPDLDDYYMAAVQLAVGRGGWPISVFALPDGRPFFAGTYFPLNDRPPHPGFLSIARSIARTWQEDRSRIYEAANELDAAIREALERHFPAEQPLDESLIMQTVAALSSEFDTLHGGFGDAPKFPPYTAVDFLLGVGDEDSRLMALQTLSAIERGGIHDHVGGGYHRYSTDVGWHLPHFEKMLYDNALMMGNFANAGQTQQALEILACLDRDFSTTGGLYGSSWDADSEGEEGKFYTWSASEISQVLGDHAPAFMTAYSIREEGNFRDEATRQRTGQNVLHRQTNDDHSHELDLLFKNRQQRDHPSFDPKEITCWNALLLSPLVAVGEIERARDLAGRLTEHTPLRRLPNSVAPAQLEDYAALLFGLATLDQNHPEIDRLWLEAYPFYDPFSGAFRTAEVGARIPGQSPVYDSPLPSANSLLARAALRTGKRALCRSLLSRLSGFAAAAPTATEGLSLAILELLRSEPAATFEFWTPQGYAVDSEQLGITVPDEWTWSLQNDRVRFNAPTSDPGLVSVRYALCNDSECLPIRHELERISPTVR